MKKYLAVCGIVLAAASAQAQIPVVGGPVDVFAVVLMQRCVSAGVPNEEIPVLACVDDARNRVLESLRLHADQTDYAEAMSRINVVVPVVVKDSRTFADSASGRLPVSGSLVMRAGKTCAWQTYSTVKNSTGKAPQIETERGTFSCDKDGVRLSPPI